MQMSCLSTSDTIFSFDNDDKEVYKIPDNGLGSTHVQAVWQNQIVDLYSNVDEVGAKFDTCESHINSQITDFKAEVNEKANDLRLGVDFIKNYFASQKEKIAELKTKMQNAIKAQKKSIN